MGRFDGEHASLACASRGGRIFVHSPHLAGGPDSRQVSARRRGPGRWGHPAVCTSLGGHPAPSAHFGRLHPPRHGRVRLRPGGLPVEQVAAADIAPFTQARPGPSPPTGARPHGGLTRPADTCVRTARFR